MFKSLLKNKKAQNTAEYALLIALVVAGVIAMQTYAQRALQARVRDASSNLTSQQIGNASTEQYEPYYLSSSYNIERDSTTSTKLIGNQQIGSFDKDDYNQRTREANGFQDSTYNTETVGVGGGL